MGLMRRLLNYQINSRADTGCLSPSLPSLSPLTAPLPPFPWLYHFGAQAPECPYSRQEEDSSVCKSRIQQLQIFLSNLLKVMVKAIKRRLFFPISLLHPFPAPRPPHRPRPQPFRPPSHHKSWGRGSQPRELLNSVWKERLRAAEKWEILL